MFSSVRGAALGTEGVEFYLESLEGGSEAGHELKYEYISWFYAYNLKGGYNLVCKRIKLHCSRKLQRRGERRATINEEMGGVYDVNVLYRGYVQLTNTKNSKTHVYTFVLHRARLKSIMHPWRPTW